MNSEGRSAPAIASMRCPVIKFCTPLKAICLKQVVRLVQALRLFTGNLLGRGATAAQRTLDPFILVRIRTPQPLVREL